MTDFTNATNATDEQQQQPQPQPQQLFTRAEVEQVVRELEQSRIQERKERNHGSEIPLAILQEWEDTTISQLKENFKLFRRSIQKYNHDTWTRSEQINKEFIPELKNWKVDAYQLTNTIYQFSETTRIQARVCTELYQQLQFLQSRTTFASPTDKEIFDKKIEQAERLSIFGFGTAKFQEETKEVAIKALKLPLSVKHLDTSTTNNRKKDTFDGEFIERFHKARFEEQLLRDATHHNHRGSYRGRFNNGFRGRCNGSRGQSWRSSASRGQSFYSGGRGRGGPFPPQKNNFTSTSTMSNTDDSNNNN